MNLTWETARAAGFTAYGLLTVSVVLGLLLSSKARTRWPRFFTNELHEFATLLALAFVGVHVAALLLDSFTPFGLADVLLPFSSDYRPLWTTAGVVALYLLAAVQITTLLRSRIGYAAWRRAHFLAFGLYALSTVHGIGAGTDSGTPWAAAVYIGSMAIVVVLTFARLATPPREPARALSPPGGPPPPRG